MTVTQPKDAHSEVLDEQRRWVPDWYSWVQDITRDINIINTITGDITTIQGEIVTIQNDILVIQGDITTIQGDITTIQGDISTIQGDITSIQSGMYVNVLDYGANNIGTADNVAAITAADAAASAAGKTLFFPSGTYNVASAVTPSAGARWLGEKYTGTILRTTSATATLISVTNDFVSIESLQFSSSVPRIASGIYINVNAVDFILRDFMINGAYIGIALGPACSIINISYGLILETVAAGSSIVIGGGLAVYINNVIANSTHVPGTHIVIFDCGDVNISDCGFILADINMTIAPPSGSTVVTVRCDNVYFDRGVTDGINIAPTGTGLVARCDFNQCWFSSAGSIGARVVVDGTSVVSGLSFIQCMAMFNGLAGFGITGGAADNTAIIGCEVTQSPFGISLATACDNVRVIGCRIGAHSGGTAVGVGVALDATDHSDCLITDNDFTGSTVPIQNLSTGARSIIRDNIGYNPVGLSAMFTAGGTPFTVTDGPTPETHYVNQGAPNNATITRSGLLFRKLIDPTMYYTVELGPNENYVINWGTTAPTYFKDVH